MSSYTGRTASRPCPVRRSPWQLSLPDSWPHLPPAGFRREFDSPAHWCRCPPDAALQNEDAGRGESVTGGSVEEPLSWQGRSLSDRRGCIVSEQIDGDVSAVGGQGEVPLAAVAASGGVSKVRSSGRVGAGSAQISTTAAPLRSPRSVPRPPRRSRTRWTRARSSINEVKIAHPPPAMTKAPTTTMATTLWRTRPCPRVRRRACCRSNFARASWRCRRLERSCPS